MGLISGCTKIEYIQIPDLLKGIGAKHHEYPDPWPEDDFGTALVVTFEGGTPTVTKFKM